MLSPVVCSGVIFAPLIGTADRPEQAIAFNTAGAMLGGRVETVSLLIGFKYLLLVAGLIYVGALVTCRRSAATRVIGEPQTVGL